MSYIAQGISWADIEGVVSTGKKYLEKAGPALKAVSAILDDPYFPEVTKLVLELQEIEKKKRKPSSKPTRLGAIPPPTKGVGLYRVVKPLRAFIYTQKNPWILPVAIAAMLGLPFLLGYAVGKRRKT